MDAQDDGLHDDEEHGDAGGGAARGGSCLNMNPMRMALPVAGGAPRAQITRWSATAEHVTYVVPALHAAIAAAGGENGRHVVLALKKHGLVKPEERQPGRPAARGAAAADDGSIVLCCGPRGLWPTELIAQMRGNLDGIRLCRTLVCQQKVPGQTRTWAQGLAMMKVSMSLNGTLPDEKLATPEHVVGTSFVLCSAVLGPDGLGDHELVVHDCAGGGDNDARRVFRRMRDLWLSDWLLRDSPSVPPREDALIYIIADAGGVGRLAEWQKTGMSQKPLASLEQVLRRAVSCSSSTPPVERSCNDQSSSRSATISSSVGSSGSAEASDASAEGGAGTQRPSKRGEPETPDTEHGARRDARLPGPGFRG